MGFFFAGVAWCEKGSSFGSLKSRWRHVTLEFASFFALVKKMKLLEFHYILTKGLFREFALPPTLSADVHRRSYKGANSQMLLMFLRFFFCLIKARKTREFSCWEKGKIERFELVWRRFIDKIVTNLEALVKKSFRLENKKKTNHLRWNFKVCSKICKQKISWLNFRY